MPSFLTKVFARKKLDAKETGATPKRSCDQSLLEGRFEAISPTVSPTAAHFIETTEKGKEKERDLPFSLFRPRSRAQSPLPRSAKRDVNTPHLTLNLPVPKEEKSRALGATFEADGTSQSLPDHLINERTLTPLETLMLVGTCSKAITERGGLEALGVMHPHWHATSLDIQRKLISLYILSLAPKSPITTLSPTSGSPSSAFDSELRYTRSPHDIAAVLRWGLRHLKLEGNSFGEPSSSDEWHWYNSFYEAERNASYSPKSFSNNLIPRLPPAHANLLISTFDIMSSLAAHAEINGFSGSKLSKFFGLWLLSVRRSSDTDDWNSFYSRWESAGRIMEHLFLSWLRDEATKHQMPKRLLELVDHYPYSSANDGFLPRSSFSTRQYEALFIRMESVIPDSDKIKSRQHPVRLISDALKSEVATGLGEHSTAWAGLKKLAGAESDTDNKSWAPVLSEILADDTIGLLALIPADTEATLSFALQSPSRVAISNRRRSMSLGSIPNGRAIVQAAIDGSTGTNGMHKLPAASPVVTPESPKNWDEFSAAGFSELNFSRDFASILLDKDIEVTDPPPARKTNKKRRRTSPLRRHIRSSLDTFPPLSLSSPSQSDPPVPPPVITKLTSITSIQLDEAFIDFWSDALLDPVSFSWPKFVICQLRRPLEVAGGEKTVSWIVIEQVFTRPSPVPDVCTPNGSSEYPEKSTGAPLRRTISPRSPLVAAASFSAAVKRFSLFGGSQERIIKRKSADGPKSPKTGEFGEVLSEEPEEREIVSTDKDGAIGTIANGVTRDAAPMSVAGAQELEHKQPNGISNVDVVPQLKPGILSNALPPSKNKTLDKSVDNFLQTSQVDKTTPLGNGSVAGPTHPANSAKQVSPVSEPSTVPDRPVPENVMSSVPFVSPVGDAVKVSSTDMELQETGNAPDVVLQRTLEVDVMEMHQPSLDRALPLAPVAVVQPGETLPRETGVDLEEVPIVSTDQTGFAYPSPDVVKEEIAVPDASDMVEKASAVEAPRDASVSAPSPPSLGLPAESLDVEQVVQGKTTVTPEHEDLNRVHSNGDITAPQVEEITSSTNDASLAASDVPITEGNESDVTIDHKLVSSSPSAEAENVVVVEELVIPITSTVPDSLQENEAPNMTATSPALKLEQEVEANSLQSVKSVDPSALEAETDFSETKTVEEPVVQTTAIVNHSLQAIEPTADITSASLALEQEQEVEPESLRTVEDVVTPALEAETDIAMDPVVQTTNIVDPGEVTPQSE